VADGRIRVGIIGGGSIAQAHLDGYLLAADAAEVTAIADIDPKNAKRSATRAGGARIFTDYRELIASGLVDAVDICLPHHLHKDAIVAAAAAGKDVLCEKPLCLTLAEAEAVTSAVASSGITLMCSHNQLFLPAVAKAREMIEGGLLGKVYEARTTDIFINSGLSAKTIGWRGPRSTAGGGELIDTGYHPTYLLLHLVGSEPVEVTAMLARHRLEFLEGEDSAQVLVQFAGGSVGTIATSWAYAPPTTTEKFWVAGEDGTLSSDGTTLRHRPRSGRTTVVAKYAPPKPHTIALAVVDFIACLREHRRPINTEVEGIQVLKVILAAYASVERKQIVALSDL
jgi:predicted dehydrogenase